MGKFDTNFTATHDTHKGTKRIPFHHTHRCINKWLKSGEDGSILAGCILFSSVKSTRSKIRIVQNVVYIILVYLVADSTVMRQNNNIIYLCQIFLF